MLPFPETAVLLLAGILKVLGILLSLTIDERHLSARIWQNVADQENQLSIAKVVSRDECTQL